MILSKVYVGYKIFRYGRTIFSFPFCWESHFDRSSDVSYIQKVDVGKYLSRESYNYLAELIKN